MHTCKNASLRVAYASMFHHHVQRGRALPSHRLVTVSFAGLAAASDIMIGYIELAVEFYEAATIGMYRRPNF